ncbi:hypothetical protein KAT92_06255 [Candidatus Babeliales bacterium]|nr:hypothetical protein [Candidatus Babeliales bacterium]
MEHEPINVEMTKDKVTKNMNRYTAKRHGDFGGGSIYLPKSLGAPDTISITITM